MNLHLSDGDRVCIIGGGPAGSFAALHLLDRASRRGLRLKVLIFEPRAIFLGQGREAATAAPVSSRLCVAWKGWGCPYPRKSFRRKCRPTRSTWTARPSGSSDPTRNAAS